MFNILYFEEYILEIDRLSFVTLSVILVGSNKQSSPWTIDSIIQKKKFTSYRVKRKPTVSV